MREKLKLIIICLLVLIAYGVAGEMEYQDELAAQRFAAEYYAG